MSINDNEGVSLINEDKEQTKPQMAKLEQDIKSDRRQKVAIYGLLSIGLAVILFYFIKTMISGGNDFELHPMYDVYSSSPDNLDKFTDAQKSDLKTAFWDPYGGAMYNSISDGTSDGKQIENNVKKDLSTDWNDRGDLSGLFILRNI
jgi:hypothetical protein